MRVLPHHQDSGGFFIAVLEKKDWLPWQRKQKRTQQAAFTEGAMEGCDAADNMEVAPRPEDDVETSTCVVPSPPTTIQQAEGDLAMTSDSMPPKSDDEAGAHDRTSASAKSTHILSCTSDDSAASVVAEKIEGVEGGEDRPPEAVLGK